MNSYQYTKESQFNCYACDDPMLLELSPSMSEKHNTQLYYYVGINRYQDDTFTCLRCYCCGLDRKQVIKDHFKNYPIYTLVRYKTMRRRDWIICNLLEDETICRVFDSKVHYDFDICRKWWILTNRHAMKVISKLVNYWRHYRMNKEFKECHPRSIYLQAVVAGWQNE